MAETRNWEVRRKDSMKKLEVIVLGMNQHKYTGECLMSLDRAVRTCDMEGIEIGVTVVDNASKKPIKKALGGYKLEYFDINHIRNEKILLFAKAMNQGMMNIGDEHICLLNNDTIVSPNFLRCHYEIINMGIDLTGPLTNHCAGIQNMGDKILDPELRLNEDDHIDLKIQKVLNLENHFAIQPGGIVERTQWCNGFCLFISNKCFRTVGFLNDEEFPLSGEEIDYGYKAYDAGMSVAVNKQSFVWHWKQVTCKQFPGSYQSYWKESAAKLCKIYPDRFPQQSVPCKK